MNNLQPNVLTFRQWYLDLYLEIIRLHTPLFFQKSTLLRCVVSAFRISSYWLKGLFFTHFPAYMKNMFPLRSSSYDLRGNCILSLGKPKTTTYGLNSFSYFSAKQWNALPDSFRNSFFADFKSKLKYRVFLYVDSFCLYILILKTVNNIFFYVFFLLLLLFYNYS